MKAWLALPLALALLAGCGGREEDGDRDGDGMTDAQERAGWSIQVDLLGRRVSRAVDSDPGEPDTDRDGIVDVYEFGVGMDPRSADTDEDGLSDCQETYHTNRSECEDEGWEGQADGGYGTIGNNADSDPGYGRYVNDVLDYQDETGTIEPGRIGWGDGIRDGDEVRGHPVTGAAGQGVVVRTDPLAKDSDGDGAEDGEEAFLFSSDPTVQDTDGDGCQDGRDPVPDRRETYRPGLVNLTWSGDGDAQLVVALRLADQPARVPAEGALDAAPGETLDLSALGQPDVRPRQCSFPPYDPWVRAELLVERHGGAFPQVLDFTSHSVPDGGFTVWLDARTGNVSYAHGGAPETLPLRWSGADGAVAWRPLSAPQAS